MLKTHWGHVVNFQKHNNKMPRKSRSRSRPKSNKYTRFIKKAVKEGHSIETARQLWSVSGFKKSPRVRSYCTNISANECRLTPGCKKVRGKRSGRHPHKAYCRINARRSPILTAPGYIAPVVASAPPLGAIDALYNKSVI